MYIFLFTDTVTRPVLIVGPLADAVVEKLLSDSSQTFAKCETEYMNCSQEALEKGKMDNVLIDFRRRGSHFECTTVAAIKDVCERVSKVQTPSSCPKGNTGLKSQAKIALK